MKDYNALNTFNPYCIFIDLTYKYVIQNIFETGVRYINLNSETEPSSNTLAIQRMHVHMGVKGTKTEQRTVTVPGIGLAYQTEIALDSSGELKTWCAADDCGDCKTLASLAQYMKYALTLDGSSSTADNGTAISALQGKTADVTVNRSFVGDGGWYTLCLPFALTADDIAEQMQGATFEAFTSITTDDSGSVALNFTKVTETEAGVPYLMKPVDGVTITKPTFSGKTIDAGKQVVTYTDSNSNKYSFKGIYDPTTLTDSDRFVAGSTGKELVMSDGTSSLKGLRAYFTMPATVDGSVGTES